MSRQFPKKFMVDEIELTPVEIKKCLRQAMKDKELDDGVYTITRCGTCCSYTVYEGSRPKRKNNDYHVLVFCEQCGYIRSHYAKAECKIKTSIKTERLMSWNDVLVEKMNKESERQERLNQEIVN